MYTLYKIFIFYLTDDIILLQNDNKCIISYEYGGVCMELAKNALELVNKCFEQKEGFLNLEELKPAFISYVFEVYQEEVVAAYDLETFYEHLDHLKLTNCRKDFHAVVEEWYLLHYGSFHDQTGYHDLLFRLVKEAVALYEPESREQLIKDVTRLLTSPTGYMARWRRENNKKAPMYFRYLLKLGIRTYKDIESLIDTWLIEQPNAFDKHQQKLLAKTSRRGRPNNLELSILFEKAYELKPELTPQEKERIRKIYYYHRKSLTTLGMVEKFKNYVISKSQANKEDDDKDSNATQAG